jgi:hypothetical protein
MQGYTGQSGFAGLIPAALLPDYRLFLWVRLWWGFAFTFRVRNGKCLAVRLDGSGDLVTSSWCEMKRLLADEWCERPVDRAVWTDDETLLACLSLRLMATAGFSFPRAGWGRAGTGRRDLTK